MFIVVFRENGEERSVKKERRRGGGGNRGENRAVSEEVNGGED